MFTFCSVNPKHAQAVFFTVLAMVCFMFAHVFGRPCLFLQLNNVLGRYQNELSVRYTILKWHENSETEKKTLLMSSAKCIFLKHKNHGRHVIFFRSTSTIPIISCDRFVWGPPSETFMTCDLQVIFKHRKNWQTWMSIFGQWKAQQYILWHRSFI